MKTDLRFMTRENFDHRFEKRVSRIHGCGCFTRVEFNADEFICEYAGERISRNEAKHRESINQINRICHVNPMWAIDGSVGGNGTHFMNHSCEPNCRLDFTGEDLFIYATRKILIGEELTVDYYAELYLDGAKCLCSRLNCLDRLPKSKRVDLMLKQFLDEIERQDDMLLVYSPK